MNTKIILSEAMQDSIEYIYNQEALHVEKCLQGILNSRCRALGTIHINMGV